MPHIVDVLIEERAERLMQRPVVWSAVRRLVYPLLGYTKAIELADHIAGMRGIDVFRHLSELLDMRVHATGLEHLPKRGPAIVVSNHPAGIADGVAVYDAFRAVREDITFFANRDAIRVSPGLEEMIVPVEWVSERRSHERRKETVKGMSRAFREERLVVIFPSGRLAQPTVRGLKERPWQPTALSLAERYGCPVVPIHVAGRNSLLYYLFYAIHTELRDMTLFRELLNKQRQHYRITIAEPFDPGPLLADSPHGSDTLTERLRTFVAEEIPRGARRFEP